MHIALKATENFVRLSKHIGLGWFVRFVDDEDPLFTTFDRRPSGSSSVAFPPCQGGLSIKVSPGYWERNRKKLISMGNKSLFSLVSATCSQPTDLMFHFHYCTKIRSGLINWGMYINVW